MIRQFIKRFNSTNFIKNITTLTAISPIDGRYATATASLRDIVSEFALIKYRVFIEINWITHLAPLLPQLRFSITSDDMNMMKNFHSNFHMKDAERIKAIETETKHDVKAIEYWLKEKCSSMNRWTEFIHFACTSEDINNLSYGLMIADCRKIIISDMTSLVKRISSLSTKWADSPMISRTHGQRATPTTVGKEFGNFCYRLSRSISQLERVSILGKINGAVGNYNAHYVAYPDVDWLTVGESFVRILGLNNNPYTTQIEPHDYISELLSAIRQFNTILIGFNRDIWGYISLGYFRQVKTSSAEVGSSTMPHKINPIDFENSEGSLGIANSLCGHLSDKLPISRYQRDLSDSTVLRTLGSIFAYCIIAYQSTLRGLERLELNSSKINEELNNSWEVLAEPIQTVMRKNGIKGGYERMKELTRGHVISKDDICKFIQTLNELPKDDYDRLMNLTPDTYVGSAGKMARNLPSYLSSLNMRK